MTEMERRGPVPWRNYHHTLERHDATISSFRNDGAQVDLLERLATTARLLGELLRDARDARERLVPLGSAWSFSDLLRPDGWLLDTTLAAIGPAPAAPEAAGRRLVLAGAGTTIREINRHLEPRLSLETSGAHDGQTIGGALGTGTHGSALGRGGIQNQVRGVHLVVAPGRSVWVEAGPAPLLNPLAAGRLADRIVLDAELLEAALVHLGGLGLVNAVLIEASPGFTVDLVRREAPLNRTSLGLLENGHFAEFAGTVWSGAADDPYYVEVILDPFRPYAGRQRGRPRPALITLLYARPPRATAAADDPLGGEASPALDALNLLARGMAGPQAAAVELLPPPQIVAEIVALQFRQEPRGDDPPRRLTWGEANGRHEPLPFGLKLYNAAFALPRERLTEALNVMLDAFAEDGGGHLVFTLRFVSNARGLLAFTRFPETVVVNMDGLRTGPSREAGRRVALALETHGIPFSQHWGKMGLVTPTRFSRDFGDPADPATRAGRWRRARYALLDADTRATLTSSSLEAWGIA